MNRAQRKALNLQHPAMTFLEISGINVILLLVIGAALLLAEVWLLTTGTPVLLVVGLLAMTGFTEFVLGQQLWEDWR